MGSWEGPLATGPSPGCGGGGTGVLSPAKPLSALCPGPTSRPRKACGLGQPHPLCREENNPEIRAFKPRSSWGSGPHPMLLSGIPMAPHCPSRGPSRPTGLWCTEVGERAWACRHGSQGPGRVRLTPQPRAQRRYRALRTLWGRCPFENLMSSAPLHAGAPTLLHRRPQASRGRPPAGYRDLCARAESTDSARTNGGAPKAAAALPARAPGTWQGRGGGSGHQDGTAFLRWGSETFRSARWLSCSPPPHGARSHRATRGHLGHPGELI